MKWGKYFLVLIAIAVFLPTMCGAVTNNVFLLKFSAKCRVQTEDSQHNAVLKSVSLKNSDLVNLARGRARTATVPANEVLALVDACHGGSLHVIVYDTSTSSNLVTVGTVGSPGDGITDGTKAELVGLFDFGTSGNATNGIDSGFLMSSGKATLGANDCLGTFTSTVMGGFSLITAETGTDPVTALVPKGTFSVQGASIGTIVESD